MPQMPDTAQAACMSICLLLCFAIHTVAEQCRSCSAVAHGLRPLEHQLGQTGEARRIICKVFVVVP